MRWPFLTLLVFVASCEMRACPSQAGGPCNPRDYNCPTGYVCASAEVCTRECEQTSDCWVPVSDGCRGTELPGQRLADGGVFTEMSEDGFCPETKSMVCLAGYCQRDTCVSEPCDYDVYGPSPWKGNRDQGPSQ